MKDFRECETCHSSQRGSWNGAIWECFDCQLKGVLVLIPQLVAAIKADPTGFVCGFCGELNFLYDDCGFFYCVPLYYSTLSKEEKREAKSLATCEKCRNGEVGKNHIKIFGLGGER